VPHPAALKYLEKPSPGHFEVEISGLGGSRRHWLMRTALLDDGSCLIRFADRSEAHAAEQMRVDFVANASHELRTPLASLIGYTETLRSDAGRLDEETRERFLSIVDEEAHRMQRIVEDLISLSRIEAERFTRPNEAVSIAPLITAAGENARRMAEKRDCWIDSHIAPDLPDVTGDQSQIVQMLDNLVTNALRYGSAGTAVSISASVEGGMVRIIVADQGEGIAPEHIKRVTERFYRVDTSRSRALGGTGLGLSIVKHILQIESEVGRGTKVHVLLPVFTASAAPKG
jgi:two-component system, OmpR family, phosphate regulon sensor histidine kinase PhoR